MNPLCPTCLELNSSWNDEREGGMVSVRLAANAANDPAGQKYFAELGRIVGIVK